MAIQRNHEKTKRQFFTGVVKDLKDEGEESASTYQSELSDELIRFVDKEEEKQNPN
jgi:hypothetical protein